jgi:membrane associated rhomboid family serine protease
MSFNDYNNPYRPSGFGYLPPVTKNIIIISAILFAAKLLLASVKHIDLDDYLGLHHHLAPNFKPYQFITYIFMHGDFSHVLMNMLGVYIFGQVLEQTWGGKRYLIFFILTGLGAAIAQYIIMNYQVTQYLEEANAYLNLPGLSIDQRAEGMQRKYDFLNANVIIGASGSLFGLLGAFGMLYPNRLLYLYFFVPIKAKWLVIGYGLLELYLGIQNSGDNVAHFAHLGGLFVGIIIVLIWRKNRSQFY